MTGKWADHKSKHILALRWFLKMRLAMKKIIRSGILASMLTDLWKLAVARFPSLLSTIGVL